MWEEGRAARAIPNGQYNYNLQPYGDADGGPTKEAMLRDRDTKNGKPFFELGFGKRPAEELYDVLKDPAQINNLAGNSLYAEALKEIKTELDPYLDATGDPRAKGQGALFENYAYYASHGAETEGLPLKEWQARRK